MKKTMEKVTIGLFCGFLLMMALLYLCLPRESFSEKEKRYLAEPPEFTLQNLISGSWGEEAETYLADHMPGRTFFVGLHAYFENLTGRQRAKEIWTYEDRLLEAPRALEEGTIQRNMDAINGFAEKLQRPVELMIIPTAGYAAGLSQYKDGNILEAIHSRAGSLVRTIDMGDTLQKEDFYRTDHHFTSGGAFKTYEAYMESLGIPPRQDFRREQFPGFRGSCYARSGLWLTSSESLELWTGSEDLQVSLGEETHEGIFWRENLQKSDMYTVFLGGNHPLVRIHNPEGQGSLLLIRDSFSNCLGGFLGESFREVVLVDLRYYKQPVSQLALQETFDHILVCYGLGNFLEDQNLVFLKR